MSTANPSLIEWAERAYAAPGVAAQFLALQSHYDQSVCLLLWAAWATRTRGVPTVSTREKATALAAVWERTVVGPLRTARTGLKTAPSLSDERRKALRDRVMADELAAEWALLDALDALTPPGTPEPSQVATQMEITSIAWSIPAPADALAQLASAFPQD